MENDSRRLPVYLLLDTSESMAGPAIEAVAQGVSTLVKELRTNPLALETAYLSVITFSRDAQQLVPLSELLHFQPPPLRVRPGTALGAALRMLIECLQRDVKKTTPTTKGDYKPLVFILTDGQPTDSWEQAADAVKQAGRPKMANVFAIGCGPDVDTDVLYRITDTVLVMPNLTPEAIRKSFVWLSASVQTVSTKVEGISEKESLNLPTPPADALQGAPRTTGPRDQTPRQVFLHALCSKNRQPYLMRFVRRSYEHQYDAVAAHRLEVLEEGDAASIPPISASLLHGIPDCPYCENASGTVCPRCRAIFCEPLETPPETTCPKCGAYLVKGGDGSAPDIKITPG
ncbi:MAG TPA: VWA domain-containing protein [Pyrinomonadaceae bacterium]|nr:VWA domain-containing protein [Pyrinomonadaceae bacterium]